MGTPQIWEAGFTGWLSNPQGRFAILRTKPAENGVQWVLRIPFDEVEGWRVEAALERPLAEADIRSATLRDALGAGAKILAVGAIVNDDGKRSFVVELKQTGDAQTLACNPGDAIIIAQAAKCPIYILDQVFRDIRAVDESGGFAVKW